MTPLSDMPIQVAALYRFASLPDCADLRGPLSAICQRAGVKGTLLLATEGINGTIAGAAEGIAIVLAHIRSFPGCADLDVKYSAAPAMPFHRMKVRLKREIVTLGVAGIDAARDAGRYVEPEDWNDVLAEPGTIVIDTRNGYEVGIGSFAGAVNPGTTSFRDFPRWFRNYRAELGEGANPRVAMFCTGGIRCEKASAFLKAEGISDVRHLKGGILRYIENIPAADSRWEGECFVFDQRVAVGQGVVPGSYDLCHACRMPVSAADKASPAYEEGVRCPACHGAREDGSRARYAERQRQMELAARRGAVHIGATYPTHEDEGNGGT